MSEVTEITARDYVFELNNGTVDSPDWVEVHHLNTWSHAPTANDADTTTYDDDGRLSHMKMSRGDSFTLSGLAQEDPDDGTRDDGQLAVEAWGNLVGPSSRKQFRITSPAGNTKTFMATAMNTPEGGGNNDGVSTWEVVITVTGTIATDTLPDLPNAPTAADATAGNDSLTLTWTEPSQGGSMDLYEVVTYIDSTDTVVATQTSSAKPVLVSGLANTTAYYCKVRARNAAGWGPYSAVSDTITTT